MRVCTISLWVALLALGCGPDETTLVVSVRGLWPEVQHLRLSTRIGGWSGTGELAPLALFRTALPAGARGLLHAELEGLDQDKICRLADGRDTALVEGGPRADLEIILVKLPQAVCMPPPPNLLVVRKMGEGQGVVFSEPQGIQCSGQERECSAPFSTEQMVTLRAVPSQGRKFVRWSGCTPVAGRMNDCQVQVRKQMRTEVVAVFAPDPCLSTGWCKEHPWPLRAVWGASADDVWAVGEQGTVVRRKRDADAWERVAGGTQETLTAIWGSGANRIWAVGLNGTIVQWKNEAWEIVPNSGTNDDLRAIWGSGPNDVWAVGWGGTIIHWDGGIWSKMASKTTSELRAIWGSGAKDVWAVGQDGTILRWQGSMWTPYPVMNVKNTLHAVWGSGADDVWAAGEYVILHWSGKQWDVVSQERQDILGIWGSGPNDVWAVGHDRLLLHWGNDSKWSVWSTGPGILYGIWGSGGTLWTVGLRSLIPGPNGDGPQILRSDGGEWRPEGAELTPGWARMHGSGPMDIWLVGKFGQILHWDGKAWASFRSGTKEDLSGVFGNSPVDAWAVGANGTALRFNNRVWSSFPSGTGDYLAAVWGSAPTKMWAVGGTYDGPGVIRHFDGGSWTGVPANKYLPHLWGSGDDDIWAVGQGGLILHHTDPTRPTAFAPVPVPGVSEWMVGIWLHSKNDDVWVVSDPGAIYRWNRMARSWALAKSRSRESLFRIWGSNPNDIWALGPEPFHFNGAGWSPVAMPYASTIWGASQDDLRIADHNGFIYRRQKATGVR